MPFLKTKVEKENPKIAKKHKRKKKGPKAPNEPKVLTPQRKRFTVMGMMPPPFKNHVPSIFEDVVY